jgi:hypothetical protein
MRLSVCTVYEMGWKTADSRFLDMFLNFMREDDRVFFVSGSPSSLCIDLL